MGDEPVLVDDVHHPCGCIDDVWSDGSRERAVNCESHLPARRVAELEQAIRDHRDGFHATLGMSDPDQRDMDRGELDARLWAVVDAES